MHLLPLDSFRAALGLHPWHFWGLASAGTFPSDAKCDGLTREYSWQGSDAGGRDDIRQAIERAEQKLLAYVGYAPAPRYVQTAPLTWPRYDVANLVRYADIDTTGRRIAMQAPEGYVLQMGTEQYTAIDAAAAVVYSTQFGSPVADTFTVSVPTTETDSTKIGVYFVAADRPDNAALSERWRIQPVQVTIAGGVATITGRRWLLIRPVLYENPALNALDPANATLFATTLGVYVRSTNGNGTTVTTSQATLQYETSDCGGWGAGYCCSSDVSSDPGTVGEVVARAGIRDKRLGLITPAAAVYDASAQTWSSAGACSGCYAEPDRVVLRYLAGYPLGPDGQMDAAWREIVAMLAAAELKTRIAACRDVNARLHELQQDLALESTETARYATGQNDLDNPFGTRRGHILAWRQARQRLLIRGTLA